MEKVVTYECKRCKKHLEKKEFHYRNFENINPKKVCWGCEIKDAIHDALKIQEESIKQKNDAIATLTSKLEYQKKLTNGVQSISFDKSMVKEGLLKHKNLNVYMDINNPDDAYFQMKGKFRKYLPVQSKYGPEMCIIVKTGYSKKWFKLHDLHKWILEEGTKVKSSLPEIDFEYS
jgi:hypothetical protein